MRPSRAAATLFVVAALLGGARLVAAKPRPRFEPTDLEMEDTGVFEIDLEFGVVKSQGPTRLVIPDFELDLGLLPNLELDIDGAYAIEGPQTGPFSPDHAAPDNLWVGAKIGLYDDHDEDSHAGRALGIQIGPKLPVARGAHGIGVESLLLIGGSTRRVTAVFNIGGFVDPSPDATSPRPVAVEWGIDLELRLDKREHYQLTGELAGVKFKSTYPDQLGVTAGFNWSPIESLDISLVGLLGFLEGNDRYGLLIGVSPKFHLFGG
jgi:hypothetical protein